MNRKKLFVALVALLMNLACRLAVAEEIKVQLDWILGGKHVPFFVARDRGYFKGKGLDVRLLEGRGSLQPAQFVDTKQADYGYGDLVTAIEVMAKGGRNRAIGTGMVFQGGGYIFLEESGIKVPKDLEGKSFGTTPGDFGQVLLPALGAAAGFDDRQYGKGPSDHVGGDAGLPRRHPGSRDQTVRSRIHERGDDEAVRGPG